MSPADRRFISGGAQRAFSTTNKAAELRAMLRAQGYLIRLRMTWLEEDQQADDRLAATARAEMPVKGCPYPRLLADAVRG